MNCIYPFLIEENSFLCELLCFSLSLYNTLMYMQPFILNYLSSGLYQVYLINLTSKYVMSYVIMQNFTLIEVQKSKISN